MIARGRRRLGALFTLLAAAALAGAVAAWAGGRIVTGGIALAAALLVGYAWRMSRELDPLWLEVDGSRLTLRTVARIFHLDLDGIEARRLTAEEKAHLASLASVGFLTASSGGYDSRLLGELELFAADLDRAVLVEASETVDGSKSIHTRWVVTPDDPASLLDAVGRGQPPDGQAT